MSHAPQSCPPNKTAAPRVGLFVTCLADLFRPSVGFASVKLLEDAGCTVEAPAAQTCCGQPAWNNGDRRHARRIARRVIEAFGGYDYLVTPSGSCAGMIREHFPALFDDDDATRDAARALAAKTWELTSFLHDVTGFEHIHAACDATLTYHDSCSGLRESGIREQPRALLRRVRGLALCEMRDADVCCGFGGAFCVKYPEISARMVSDKTHHVRHSGAAMLAGGDLGCLMNIAGRLRREGSAVRVYHVAEVLAGMSGAAAIAMGDTGGNDDTGGNTVNEGNNKEPPV